MRDFDHSSASSPAFRGVYSISYQELQIFHNLAIHILYGKASDCLNIC